MPKHNDKMQNNHNVGRKKELNFRARMKSVHNKMSRGAEYIWTTIRTRFSFGQKGSPNTYNKKKVKSLNRPK